MNAILLRAAFLLRASDLPAQVFFAHTRKPLLTVRGEPAACLDCGRVTVLGVLAGSTVILRAHTPKVQTAEEIARHVQARQLLVDAVEMARRASLTPEQREREDRPACDACEVRDPLPGQARCGFCSEREAA